jgi:hypothetical protein
MRSFETVLIAFGPNQLAMNQISFAHHAQSQTEPTHVGLSRDVYLPHTNGHPTNSLLI